jgi:hypothetical protein
MMSAKLMRFITRFNFRGGDDTPRTLPHAPARIAIEAVSRVIPVDFHLGMCGVNFLHFLCRNMRILLAEMQHHRRRGHLAGIVRKRLCKPKQLLRTRSGAA